MPVSASSDHEARAVIRAAFAARGIAAPSLGELQAAQAIGRFEGGYGKGWGASGNGSHNWGAIQCGHTAPCGPGCFEYGDSHADGTGYRGCFRRYPSAVAGAGGLLHELYRRDGVPEAMRDGDATRIASAMRATGYFEAPADKYARAIELNAAALAASVGEPHVVVRGGGRVVIDPSPSPPPQPPASPSPPHRPSLPSPPWGWGGRGGGDEGGTASNDGGLLVTLALVGVGATLLAWRASA